MFGIWKYKLAADAGKFWKRKVFCHFAQWTRRGKYNTDRRYNSSADIFCNSSNNNNSYNHRSREHCGPRARAAGGVGGQAPLPGLLLGDAGGGGGGARLLRPRPRPRLHAEAGQQQGHQQGHQQGQQGHGCVTPEWGSSLDPWSSGDCADRRGRVPMWTSFYFLVETTFKHSRLRQDILQ